MTSRLNLAGSWRCWQAGFYRLLAMAGLVLFSLAANAQTAAALTDLGTKAPVPGPNDQTQLSIAGQADMPDGLNYYTDNQVSYNTGEPGQTFSTGNAEFGYLFTSLAIKTGGGTTDGTTVPQGYLLHIYSVAGGNATLLATYSATNFAFNDGDWVQWSGFSLTLTNNATYAFSFGKISIVGPGWEGMGNASGNPYPGGELGLMPVAGGAITFGSSHGYDATFDVGLTLNGPPAPPVVTNLPASAVQTTVATMNGKIVTTGGSTAQVTIYYGTTDGGTNPAAWANKVALGSQSGSYSYTLNGLQSKTKYYFTATATNSTGGAWAVPSLSFATQSPAPPVVTNLPATSIAATIATLNGLVVSNGNQWPAATIYYGSTDGGTNPAAWSNHLFVGIQPGSFSGLVAGLAPGTTYYFTTYVTNSAGSAWGGFSKSFNTLTVVRMPVVTYHYDNTRQGVNTNETVLNPSNVNVTNFGKLFTYTVDGQVYAQPLVLTNLYYPGKGVRNVVFVATEHDSVYAFDADSNADANGGLLWFTNLGIAAVMPNNDFGNRYGPYHDLDPEMGITATPVIDPVAGTIYMDVFTHEGANYFHRIHALNLTNGAERPFSPVTVKASVPGKGVDSVGGVVTFTPTQQHARPALTLAGGVLYVAYGSYADTDPYHGWVLGYNATNLLFLTNCVFNTTPNATVSAFGGNAAEGALWMGGNGLSVDANTNLYFETANGSFSQNTNGGDYSDSFMKLSTTAGKLAVADYFTPYNQASLQANDADLGSGGPILLPDSVGSTAHPHLIVGAGKEGKLYLVDRDNMGRYNAANDNQIVQTVPGAIGSAFDSPAYFNHQIYYQGDGDVMKAFAITNGVITPTPVSRSSTSFGYHGSTPVISANGLTNGIAWVIQGDAYSGGGPAVLHAYNAANLAQELYNSSLNLARDNPGPALKFTLPVITGGKVYVGAAYSLSVYGNALFLSPPTIAPAGGGFTNSVTVTLSEAASGGAIYYTLDGSAPTVSSTLYTGPFTVTNSVLVQAIAAAPGAVNSSVTRASFLNGSAIGAGAGLLAQYWANTTSTAFTSAGFTNPPTLTRTDAFVNFNWNTVGPDPSVGQTYFTARWTGSVLPQFNETYTFYGTADDGVRVWVNGQLLADGWVDQAATTYKGSITLHAQQLYNIRMDYYQGGGLASAQLAWSSPSTPQAVIPTTQLYPYTNPPPTVALMSPANGAGYTASASVTLNAEADAPYNPIAAVNFYANHTLVGSVSNAPYTVTATGLAAGNYALTAVAVDGSGLSSTSAPVTITVAPGSGLAYGLTSNAPVAAFLNMPTTINGALPPLLSQTGVYSNTASRTPAAGLIPYAPNAPQWKDNAVSSWLMALPNNGGSITPGEQIQFQPTNAWSFPAGSVFVKNFDLVVNQTNANVPVRRLETEVLVRDNNGSVYGVTYKWRPDNSDADLLASSSNEDITVTNAAGVSTQTWYYASPADCQECHNTSVNGNPMGIMVLGVNARQLNGSLTYLATGVTDNQLRTLNRLGLINPAINEAGIGGYARLVNLTNTSASLEARVRSYLDANCEQCHQPGGQGITWDARYDTPLAQQNITNYPASFTLGISDHACVVKAQDVWRSVLVSRINTLDQDIQMPDFRNLIDTNAVQVITDWINSLPGTPALAPPMITPDGGNYVGSVNITLSASDPLAAIYYTLDGSLPTTNSSVYSSPLVVNTNAMVSATAFRAGYDSSVAASALLFVQPLYFSAQGFLPNGQFQLGFNGAPGSNYVLQATTNFINWIPLSTNSSPTNPLNLVDPGASNYPFRFYRVQQP